MPDVPGARDAARVLRRLLLTVVVLACGALAPAGAAARWVNPLSGRAMWIWELPSVDGGNLAALAAGARRYGIRTLIIKSGDGTSPWSQFNPSLVAYLHARGLRVCAWQYVYGNYPGTEADVGAAAVRDGADCLVVDAEVEYEGKYVSAQSYIHRLRELIGYRYPLALAGFPYVDYHPGFPYSVFLGPGGAQNNAPQMYWRDIGTTTDGVFAHTYAFNLVYHRRIFPLGQAYGNPPLHQIVRFRKLARVYRAAGVSWWSWQDATAGDWGALSRPEGGVPGYTPYTAMASLGLGAQGDMVVWAQEHLLSAGEAGAGIDGGFGPHTQAAVIAFQTADGLTPDGVIGPQTWAALLRYRTARVRWVAAGGLHAVVTRAGGTIVAPVPKSARRPAKRDEIPPDLGAGRPRRRNR